MNAFAYSADPASFVASPFDLRDDGVYLRNVDKLGRETATRICGRLEVQARSRSFEDTDWGRVVVVTTAAGTRREIFVPEETISGSPNSLIGLLARNGLELAPDGELRKLLPDYILSCNPPTLGRHTAQTGWCAADTFILPPEVIGTPREPVRVERRADIGFSANGTLDDWKQSVAAPAVGNSRLMFAVSFAFSGPILDPMQQENLGVHLRGRSSTGKTTAAAMAASVWGAGDPRFVRSWRATDNALEPLAASRSDTLLVLDEISQAAPRVVAEATYLLMNGQGKARMTRNAEPETARRWRIALLSTGETSLSGMLARGAGRVLAGQEVRLIDLPADAGAGMGVFERTPDGETPNTFARRLANATTAHFGVAGPTFVRKLIDEGMGELAVHHQFIAKFVDEHCAEDVDGQVRRVAHRFGLVGLAGELATRFEILPWEEGDAYEAAGRCFRDWLTERSSATAHEAAAGIQCVQDFLLRYGHTRFSSLGGPEERPAANRAGFRQAVHGGGTDYYVFPSVFQADICPPLDYRDVLRELDARGFLNKGKNSPSVSKRLPGYGNAVKVYHIRSAVLEAGDEDAPE